MKQQKDAEQKLARLQLLEQNLQVLSAQRQNLQAQLSEIANALEELSKTKGEAYKIISNVMIASDKKDLEKDLNSKKELLELRIKSVERQEEKMKNDANILQSEVLEGLKNAKEHQ